MRISHKHKFVYISTPKAGSTSVRSALDDYVDIRSVGDKNSPYHHHVSANALKKHFEEKEWNWDDYFKFAFVRNPWDRLTSRWEYKHKQIHKHKSDKYDVDGEYSKLCEKLLTKVNYDFNNFIVRLVRNKKRRQNLSHSHLSFLNDKQDKNLLDFVGKTETFQEDFDTVCDKIGIPKQKLPHLNKTKKKYKHYTEYYDDNTRQLVANLFADDIKAFGYKFKE